MALVLGAGGWGTAIALHLYRKGIPTVLVPHRNPARARELAQSRENRPYLPGVKLPLGLTIAPSLDPWLDRSSWLFLAVPMKGLGPTLELLRPKKLSGIAMISLVKGLDQKTLKRPSQLIREKLELPAGRIAVLSGPSHAEEVGRGGMTAVVLAGSHSGLVKSLQDRLGGGNFRVYAAGDIAGVELAGALKNIIALAAGMADGLGLGDNAKAALVSRGLAELARLGQSLGAKRETFFGLAGLGDLIVTCYSGHGRNLRVGRALGRGLKLNQVLAKLGMVAEGVDSAGPALRLARRKGVDTPLIRSVEGVLRGRWTAKKALKDLLGRTAGREWR